MIVLMILIALIVLGLALGSFINATVWRLHEQTKAKSKKRRKELSITTGRSMCPHCNHPLAWYDLIPLLSWVSLRGKCRYCAKTVSMKYPLAEVLFAALLAVSYIYWPYALQGDGAWLVFFFWALSLMFMFMLALYDVQWMILPNILVYPFLASVLAYSAGNVIQASDSKAELLSKILGSIIFGGFFWLVYQISKGKWIGGGDVRLGFVLGILLGWQKSLLTLAGAAYLATAVIIVIALLGKYHKKMRLPFGPFLLSAAYLSVLFGQSIIDAYKRLSGL